MSIYNKIWLVISFIFIIAAALSAIGHPSYGDETHFVETIRLFSSASWPDIIKDYPEVTTPLVYIIYAAWGKLVGTGLIELRILSLIISILFLFVLYLYVISYTKNEKLGLLLCALVIINPYIWGLSVFIFTDMLTLLFVLSALYMFTRDKPGLTAFLLGMAVLCRQYAIIFTIALWLYISLRSYYSREKRTFFKYTLYLFISLIPLIVLTVIWKGLSPPSGTKKFILDTGLFWNPHALVTYITFSAIYIFPLLLIFNTKFFAYKKLLIPAVIISCLYFIFPVGVSKVTSISNNLDTVGLIHKLLFSLAGRGVLSEIILFVFFFAGIWIILIFLKEDIHTIQSGRISPVLLLSLCYYIFLMIMPFSYQVWEKYLILILPVLSLRTGLLFPYFLQKHAAPSL